MFNPTDSPLRRTAATRVPASLLIVLLGLAALFAASAASAQTPDKSGFAATPT